MRKNGAEIVPVYSGSQTLVDAVSECMRYWVANCESTSMCVGSTVCPNIFVTIIVISDFYFEDSAHNLKKELENNLWVCQSCKKNLRNN